MTNPTEVPAAGQLKWFGRTDRGKVRANNEDAFLGLQFDSREVYHLGKVGAASLTTTDFAFAVSDGMGGAKSGEYASRIAVEKITRLLPRSFALSPLSMTAPAAFVPTSRIRHGRWFCGRADRTLQPDSPAIALSRREL